MIYKSIDGWTFGMRCEEIMQWILQWWRVSLWWVTDDPSLSPPASWPGKDFDNGPRVRHTAVITALPQGRCERPRSHFRRTLWLLQWKQTAWWLWIQLPHPSSFSITGYQGNLPVCFSGLPVSPSSLVSARIYRHCLLRSIRAISW